MSSISTGVLMSRCISMIGCGESTWTLSSVEHTTQYQRSHLQYH
jgi:hypothetical protein